MLCKIYVYLLQVEMIRSSYSVYQSLFYVMQDLFVFVTGGNDLQFVLSLPKPVVSCIAGLIIYLKDFHLDSILKLTK